MTRNIPRTLLGACVLAAVTAATVCMSTQAAAQAYPTRPVRIMVGASPGGGTDIIARLLAQKFSVAFGQSFVVENRPGASNTIAADVAAKAAPDGYTLLLATNTAQSIAPHIMKLGFDPIKDLTPVSLIVVVPNVVLVSEAVPAKDMKELVTLIKASPGSFSYGSSGTGSTQHLAGEAFALATGTKMVHVPYKGSAQALVDLVSGQIQLDFDTTSSGMGMIKAGKVKALAVMSAKRAAELPEVPTLAEAGYPGIEMTTWYGLFVTAGTPPDIVKRLHEETAKALKSPDVDERLRGLGGEPGSMSSDQFGAMHRADFERFRKLIRDANLKIDN